MTRKRIPWPCLIVELDTTGTSREDCVLSVVCVLMDISERGDVETIDAYTGYAQASRPSSPDAFSVHRLSEEFLRDQSIDKSHVQDLVASAACIVSRNPKFTARKLHALAPECLSKRWYEYPARVQGYPRAPFPATVRMAVLVGDVESFGYGRKLSLKELLLMEADRYTLVFDEDGPPSVTVKFGRRKIVGSFSEALLKCEIGTRFRLHGKEDYEFITGYCDSGAAYRERAFRLANTPANLELVFESQAQVVLEKIEGLTYSLALK